MARAIDADELQELCNRRIQDTWNSGTAPVSWAAAYADFKDDIDSMPTLTPPNEPLTLEQLREMDGQPVWDSSLRCWGIVKSEKDGDVFLQTKSGEFGLDPLGRVKIYRRPPEGEA